MLTCLIFISRRNNGPPSYILVAISIGLPEFVTELPGEFVTFCNEGLTDLI